MLNNEYTMNFFRIVFLFLILNIPKLHSIEQVQDSEKETDVQIELTENQKSQVEQFQFEEYIEELSLMRRNVVELKNDIKLLNQEVKRVNRRLSILLDNVDLVPISVKSAEESVEYLQDTELLLEKLTVLDEQKQHEKLVELGLSYLRESFHADEESTLKILHAVQVGIFKNGEINDYAEKIKWRTAKNCELLSIIGDAADAGTISESVLEKALVTLRVYDLRQYLQITDVRKPLNLWGYLVELEIDNGKVYSIKSAELVRQEED